MLMRASAIFSFAVISFAIMSFARHKSQNVSFTPRAFLFMILACPTGVGRKGKEEYERF